MLKYDFHTYVDSFIDTNKYQELMNKKNEIIEKFNKSDMIGWTERVDDSLINDIKDTANYIKENLLGNVLPTVYVVFDYTNLAGGG